MGYQECFEPITHLAEAAGIRDAIAVYENNPEIPGYCNFYCATKTKPTYEKLRELSSPELYACIGGDRCVVGCIASYFVDYMVPGFDWEYSDYFEDLNNELLDKAAAERPDLAELAKVRTSIAFEKMELDSIKRSIGLQRQCEAARPIIEEHLKQHGSVSYQEITKIKQLEGFDVINVLHHLEYDGFIVSKHSRRSLVYSLAEGEACRR